MAEKFRHGFKAWAERESIKLRKEMDLLSHQPLSAFQLAEHLGIKVLTPYDIPNFSLDRAKILLNKDSPWSALTMLTESGQRIIIHNLGMSPNRQQSNIMHELAHIICDHDMPELGSLAGVPLPVRTYNEEHESEATWLGANLQITREGLVWALKNGMSVDEMSSYYTASKEIVTMRLNRTGVKRQMRFRK